MRKDVLAVAALAGLAVVIAYPMPVAAMTISAPAALQAASDKIGAVQTVQCWNCGTYFGPPRYSYRPSYRPYYRPYYPSYRPQYSYDRPYYQPRYRPYYQPHYPAYRPYYPSYQPYYQPSYRPYYTRPYYPYYQPHYRSYYGYHPRPRYYIGSTIYSY